MSLPDVSPGDPHVAAHNIERQAINELNAWKDRAFLEGDGFPYDNAPVSIAPVGTEYIDRLRTNGARLWVRINEDYAGWKVIDGDTGWRKLDPQLAHLSTANSTFMIRRINELVHFSPLGPELTGTALASGDSLFMVPDTFRPATGHGVHNGLWAVDTESSLTRRCALVAGEESWSAFSLVVYGTTALTSGALRFMFPPVFTKDPWPFTLPEEHIE